MTISATHGERRSRNEALREQIDDMLGDLHRRTDRLARALAAVAALRAEAVAPDGSVRVLVDASGSVVEIDIAPEAFAKTTPLRLGEALTAAAREAAETARTLAADLMAPVSESAVAVPDLPDLIPGAPSLRNLLPVVDGSDAPDARPAAGVHQHAEGPGWAPGGSVLRGAER